MAAFTCRVKASIGCTSMKGTTELADKCLNAVPIQPFRDISHTIIDFADEPVGKGDLFSFSVRKAWIVSIISFCKASL